ncbi:MAG TPA: hypothetical protein VLX60_07845 [Terriglobales bacterium]|nr:hypothetical protein [Terriglobales bacterium]
MTEPVPAPAPPPEVPRYRWYHVARALIFIVFCMEVGMFLVIFPWSDFWDRGIFATLAPQWRLYWDNSYLRGAVSGLGIVNVYISLAEIFRLRRFVRH